MPRRAEQRPISKPSAGSGHLHGAREQVGLEARERGCPVLDLRGREGLRLLSGCGAAEVTAPQPEEFEARLGRIELDEVVLELLEAGPHRSDRSGVEAAAAASRPVLMLTLLRSGTLQVQLDDVEFTVRPGEFFLLDGRSRCVVEATSEVRVLRSSIGSKHLPALLGGGDVPLGRPLGPTSLTHGFASFVLSLLRTADADGTRSRREVTGAVVGLHSALIAEARQHQQQPSTPEGLRGRMVAYIESNLTDPDLTPMAVAAAMEISLRHAHGIFNDEDHTLARFIRDRRIAAVATTLRDAPDREHLGSLARRNGFVNTDVMTRAFKSVHGVTPSRYRDLARRHDG